ncbi:aspartate aminotransferase family protein [Acidomonas methanolica]|uniref:Aminotransferase, beta alanine--pyruvate transaminase n=1 Tax=Acidomonas methanolica NBRC 104435 TaxID=1231351 RepID=A0A023D4N9_ACIMT|nr:aspartate aminotransferase family protein [Acidomonas methanolica]MBU2653285.1 aspartate aminotransferase family protein [Acidomonas methanolica]TCS32234.1 beta-alanine--pyruvate transaminase [Acidomonas methanolica]GAJ29039.1 aminotransferase, beta alanine--pyruvate transaminase [Acidomonas methanolica NBRC 104435]GBQ49924.1 beta alanine--pyruvate transaminase [Acidomonas methanolica]GEK97669.1 aspartate aminotransferase family protein [Acidomonas methanolica NBRC 104435]
MDAPTNLDALWLPFTANRQFRAAPRMLVSAKGMYYTDDQGHQVLDACAGLWCVNAGHARPRIVEAVQKAVATLDFAPSFQMGHPLAFEAANRVARLAPGNLNHVFFCNSGSEAGDSALKIALAYHRQRGDAARTKLIGRERGYHGVGFGGMSVGGIAGNRKLYGNLLGNVDHLPHTHDPARNAFSRGQPEHGAELADALERIVALHDASTIAAVIVEPLAGSTGVLPAPKGYLQRLRDICTAHGILLIFDEVITGFGRLGASFAAEKYGVVPDIMTVAKGITNGTVPMGAAIVSDTVFDAFMQGPPEAIDLPHGYTYSAHPIACAAAIATLDTYADEHLFERAAILAPYLEEAVHGLRGLPHVTDIRNEGLVAAVELEPRNAPTSRAYEVFDRAFHKGVLVRYTGDTIAFSPPLIVEKAEIDRIVETLAELIREVP